MTAPSRPRWGQVGRRRRRLSRRAARAAHAALVAAVHAPPRTSTIAMLWRLLGGRPTTEANLADAIARAPSSILHLLVPRAPALLAADLRRNGWAMAALRSCTPPLRGCL